MDIMELGAIGELVGGVAVIGSLIFVGLQVRQSNRLVSNAAFRGVLADTNAIVRTLSADTKTVEFYLEGLQDKHDSNRERIRFDMMVGQIFRNSESMYHHFSDGDISAELWESYERTFARLIKQPGCAESWRRQRSEFTRRFAAHVDQQVLSTSDGEL